MTLPRIMVYTQLIEDSKLRSLARSLKRSGASYQEKTRFKHYGGSKDGKPTCANIGKKHYGECLLGTGSFFGCGKDGHKVRDCPMIASRGREGKQVSHSIAKHDASTKRGFYALRSRVEKLGEKASDDDVCKFSFFC